MSNHTVKEFLQDSIDSWQQSANHNKRQIISSFILAGIGIVPAVVGAEALYSGDVVGGLAAVGFGGVITAAGAHEVVEDLKLFADSNSTLAIRQDELERNS